MSRHIYIHYPYCLYKCHYCDFNSHAYERSQIPQRSYTDALLAEIGRRERLWQDTGAHFFAPGESIQSIFFGGGTPSLMDPRDVSRLLEELGKRFAFAPDIEITLESNPGTVTDESFTAFHAAGINRVSIGVQSLNEKFLSAFGRIHSAQQALQAIGFAQQAGFERVSADLIFGFPGQTLQEWQDDLEKILTLGLKHISCYALTAEPGTQFTKDVKSGVWSETAPDLFYDMLRFTHERLAGAGLPAYEISNFAAPGEESRHNLGYWNFQEYIGLGAGAYGQYLLRSDQDAFLIRTMNHKAPEHYKRTVLENASFFDEELISQDTAIKEALMMGLRLKDGISLAAFQSRFGTDLTSRFTNAIRKNLENGRLRQESGKLLPTPSGFFQNNALVLDFFDDLP